MSSAFDGAVPDHALKDGFEVRRQTAVLFSFLVDDRSGRRFGYSGDLGGLSDMDLVVREPMDLFLCGACHGGLNQIDKLIEVFKGRPIKKLVLTYLFVGDRSDPKRLSVIPLGTQRPLAVTSSRPMLAGTLV